VVDDEAAMTDRKCDGCGKTGGHIRTHQSNGSDFRELWLCRSCASLVGAEQSLPAFGPTVSELLGTLAGESGTRVCPTCGTRFKQIRQTGHVGCAMCYQTFRNRIQLLLAQMGLTDSHIGRYPSRLASYKRLLVDRIAMKEDLEAAVESEDYEQAAWLRDRIRSLEEGPDDG
jgi:protein arginine kinase activator